MWGASELANPIERLVVKLLPRLPERWVARMAGEPTVIRGRTLDPWVQLITRRAAGETPMHELTPVEARARADAAIGLAAGPPRAMGHVEHRSIPVPAETCSYASTGRSTSPGPGRCSSTSTRGAA